MLTRRLTMAMVTVAVATAAAIAWLVGSCLQRAAMTTGLERLGTHAALVARDLDQLAAEARADALVLSRAPSVTALAARRSGDGRTADGVALDDTAALFRAYAMAKPAALKVRLIGSGPDAREIVRIDRLEDGGTVRVVPEAALQSKGDRPFVRQALALAADDVAITPIELNQEHGAVAVPSVPVFRASTPVVAADGRIVGIVSINVALTETFARLRRIADGGRAIYVVSDDGSYLLHPRRELEFGRDLGRPTSWQRDFAAWFPAGPRTGAFALGEDAAGGEPMGAAYQPTTSIPAIGVIDTLPRAALVGTPDGFHGAAAAGVAIIVVGALCLAAWLERVLVRPLRAVTAGVEVFGAGGTLPAPVDGPGEIGILSRAFARLAHDIGAKTDALRSEIAERRRVEGALAEQLARERQYLAVVESSNEAIVALDLDGRVVAWNAAAERLFGWSAAEAIGCAMAVMDPPDRRAEIDAAIVRVLRGESVERFDTVQVARDGRRVDVSLGVSPVMEASGRVVGVSKIAHDLSGPRRAERRFRDVVEACPSGVCVVDADGRIQLVNDAVEQLFGYSRDELIGQPIELLVPQRLRTEHVNQRRRFAIDPSIRPMGAGRDLFGRRRDGAEVAIEIGLRPFDDRAAGAVLCSIVDVTERRRAHRQVMDYARRLERSNADLEQFAYVVSHDLKAPLRGIAMVAEWLGRDFAPLVDDDARDNIDLMLERTGRLARLIDGILMYSRVGRQEVTPTTVDVAALVADVVASIAVPPSIAIEVAGPLPPVRYDETQLRQIFQNLIANAVHHLGKPSGTIVVSCARDGGGWCFSVRDDGVGIPERHWERIFGLFQTLRPKDESKSTGAGLAIVKRIVERNGGTITVRSSEGEGAEFRFTVPRETDVAAASSAAEVLG